jgi:predicted Zn-dependent peptidase
MKSLRTKLGYLVLIAVILGSGPTIAQVKNYNDIKYRDLPEFDIPEPTVYTLGNGLTVFLMEDHELPLISLRARIRTGSNYMPADREGLGSIFGQVQREGGTTSMTGDEIDDFLEARAAFVETGMGGDAGNASMNCLKEHFDDVFAVFIDVLRQPAFAEDKIELAKIQLNTSIARRNDNVSGIIGREFRRLIYGVDSPLARLAEYTTVARVTRADLLDWHAKHYHPNNIYLGVVGDFDTKEMKRKIETALGSWAKGPEFAEGEVPYRKELPPGVHFIQKDDVTQANIRAGHLGIRRDNPDYYAVQVMNEVLGGGFSGRLLKNIRSEKGLAYSVFGGIGSSFLRPGVFQVGMSTKSSTMAESVRALQEEVAGIIRNPPTQAEMQHAKETILNSFVFNYVSRGQILGQQMTFSYYGLPLDYLEQYRANIEKVKPEDVARVAKKYIHPDKMVLLVVGKSEEFDEPVSTFGEAEAIDITIPPPPDTRPQVEKTASSVEAGGSALTRMARAVRGGAAEPVRAVRASTTVTVKMGGQSISLQQETSIVLPDKIRHTVQSPMGEQVVVINAGKGVAHGGGQTAPLPTEMVEQSLLELSRELLFLADHAESPDVEAVAAGSDEVNGVACEIVSVSFKDIESRLCIDETGKVLKQSYQGEHPFRKTPGLIELMLTDYAEIDGRQLPRTQTTLFEGEEVATQTLESVEINPELDAALFELPATE